jgi:uncharacterized protein (DUF433 family)
MKHVSGFVLRRLEPHLDTILQAYSEGATFEELSERFSCSRGTIRRFMLSHDVVLRPTIRKRKLDSFKDEVIHAYETGIGIDVIAARFQVLPQTVRNFVIDKSRADLGGVCAST